MTILENPLKQTNKIIQDSQDGRNFIFNCLVLKRRKLALAIVNRKIANEKDSWKVSYRSSQ
jgi:hypothetical protein